VERGQFVLDMRGAVYVEFLIAFGPVFLLFLGICQLALIATANVIVRHSAYAAVRSAIVVLGDEPKYYANAPRGSLEQGEPDSGNVTSALLTALGIPGTPSGPEGSTAAPSGGMDAYGESRFQRGARMEPVRMAAYLPLLVLAPKAINTSGSSSLSGSLPSNFVEALPIALAFTRSAAVVTVHTRAGTDELAPEPVPRDSTITVRVTYLYECGVPLVRALVCRTLASLLEPHTNGKEGTSQRQPNAALGARLELAEVPELVPPEARFAVLSAEVTLPNQAAAYDWSDS
jgi:hypothetical protein